MRPARAAFAALTLASTLAVARTIVSYRAVPPALRRPAILSYPSITGPRTLALYRRTAQNASTPWPGVTVTEHTVPGGPPVVVHDPVGRVVPTGAVLWLHGGGMFMGSAVSNNDYCGWLAEQLGAVVIAVDYRLAPEHPFPAAVEDCDAALRWAVDQAETLGIDASRIAIAGASAGGLLAASTCLLVRERGGVAPCFQLLRYPGLDPRTRERRWWRQRWVWTGRSTAYAWRCYLGGRALDELPAYAAPALAADLSGLPPAWIGVGSDDLFLAEDTAYARALAEAGVPVELDVEPGMYHGADGVAGDAAAMIAFRAREVAALRTALS
ncbi:alpha/beta hydrolase [Nocardioides limicola]|uniref:alpha/beta hydrolase n=1 Tax=Nocardioides limicola TaxID=2803368 RepID=UPI00193BAC87|nr:alpha/beta hydrolase [Nocardioides sp. DJM-14]